MQAPPDLPNCLELTESQRADCYVASTTDRPGYVVYEGYRGCLNSWLALPGFMLLPTWGLASEPTWRSKQLCVRHTSICRSFSRPQP
jgi:hypothetical protein